MKGLTTMKRHRHSPEQVVRKLREGERLLNDGKDLTKVLRHRARARWRLDARVRVDRPILERPARRMRLRHDDCRSGRESACRPAR